MKKIIFAFLVSAAFATWAVAGNIETQCYSLTVYYLDIGGKVQFENVIVKNTENGRKTAYRIGRKGFFMGLLDGRPIWYDWSYIPPGRILWIDLNCD